MPETLMAEAQRYRARAEENRTKMDGYRDALCRSTMKMLAEQADHLAERATTQALAFDAALRLAKETEMLSKSGLHPYRAGLFFILRENERNGPKSRAAVTAGDVAYVSTRGNVRMLANMFNKTAHEVARDVIELWRGLEDGPEK